MCSGSAGTARCGATGGTRTPTRRQWNVPFQVAGPMLAESGPVTSVARTGGHLDVFWVGRDGSVWSNWWDQTQQRRLESVPSRSPGRCSPRRTRSPPSPARPGILDVFWVGRDGSVWSTGGTRTPTSAKWNVPFQVAGPMLAEAGAVSAVARTPGTWMCSGSAGTARSGATGGTRTSTAPWNPPRSRSPGRCSPRRARSAPSPARPGTWMCSGSAGTARCGATGGTRTPTAPSGTSRSRSPGRCWPRPARSAPWPARPGTWMCSGSAGTARCGATGGTRTPTAPSGTPRSRSPGRCWPRPARSRRGPYARAPGCVLGWPGRLGLDELVGPERQPGASGTSPVPDRRGHDGRRPALSSGAATVAVAREQLHLDVFWAAPDGSVRSPGGTRGSTTLTGTPLRRRRAGSAAPAPWWRRWRGSSCTWTCSGPARTARSGALGGTRDQRRHLERPFDIAPPASTTPGATIAAVGPRTTPPRRILGRPGRLSRRAAWWDQNQRRHLEPAPSTSPHRRQHGAGRHDSGGRPRTTPPRRILGRPGRLSPSAWWDQNTNGPGTPRSTSPRPPARPRRSVVAGRPRAAAPGRVLGRARRLSPVRLVGPEHQRAKWNAPFNVAPPGSAAPGLRGSRGSQGAPAPGRVLGRARRLSPVRLVGPEHQAKWNAPFNVAPPGSAAPGGGRGGGREQLHLDVFWIGPDSSVRTAGLGPRRPSGRLGTAGRHRGRPPRHRHALNPGASTGQLRYPATPPYMPMTPAGQVARYIAGLSLLIRWHSRPAQQGGPLCQSRWSATTGSQLAGHRSLPRHPIPEQRGAPSPTG